MELYKTKINQKKEIKQNTKGTCSKWKRNNIHCSATMSV